MCQKLKDRGLIIMVRAKQQVMGNSVRKAMRKKILTLQQAVRKQATEFRGW
jgi:hypothetical protein